MIRWSSWSLKIWYRNYSRFSCLSHSLHLYTFYGHFAVWRSMLPCFVNKPQPNGHATSISFIIFYRHIFVRNSGRLIWQYGHLFSLVKHFLQIIVPHRKQSNGDIASSKQTMQESCSGKDVDGFFFLEINVEISEGFFIEFLFFGESNFFFLSYR